MLCTKVTVLTHHLFKPSLLNHSPLFVNTPAGANIGSKTAKLIADPAILWS